MKEEFGSWRGEGYQGGRKRSWQELQSGGGAIGGVGSYKKKQVPKEILILDALWAGVMHDVKTAWGKGEAKVRIGKSLQEFAKTCFNHGTEYIAKGERECMLKKEPPRTESSKKFRGTLF